MTISSGPTGDLVRVRGLSDDRRRVYLELRSGQTATADCSEPADWAIGTVLFHTKDGERTSLEPAPPETWPEESWVGIVRLKVADAIVVDRGGLLRLIPRNTVDCSVGNTVEARDASGVVRVLADEPIRLLDLPDIDDTAVDRFIPPANDATFDDFGGLESVKTRARELIETPFKYRESLEVIRARPVKGVLFTGEPGTGKTLLARIIANQSEATFYEISGPAIFSKWYGESEKILRAVFARAAKQARSIIFFDEIDSIAAQRSNEAHEQSKRVVAQLLTLMDGFNTSDNIVVVAATNRPQDIDVALLRPGRFDWIINFPLPNRKDREAILRISASRHTTSGDLPHDAVAERTETWSGADLSAIWKEAAILAVTDNRKAIMAEDYLGGFSRAQKIVRSQRQRTTHAGERTYQ